jgi:RNA polymerase II-associated factor 1
MHLSDGQKEKSRKRKEHAAKMLGKHGIDGKRSKPASPEEAESAFQELFAQRAQGFQIDFRFRNAPPRPPVGPCFVGSGLDGVLLDTSQYRPLNSVEVNYSWKLHSEPDLGVPLAPSAMDPKSYTPSTAQPTLHPDDENLLEWKGSLGDTAAEELKKRKDHARAAARLALLGKSPAKFLEKAKSPVAATASTKKAFSRVLDETMQSWMKKTTYLSNDYSRKVHDFKSLAKTKDDIAKDLEIKQKQIYKNRSPTAIAQSFSQNTVPIRTHPTKKNLKPLAEMPLLPNVEHWGHAYTHVVMDKSPGDVDKLGNAFVANVQKRDANARMTCQLFIPSEEDSARYQAIQQYELDVLPLKEEDGPHNNFCIWMDPDDHTATYVPISSRVQLSTGRPLKKKNFTMIISRRAMNETDVSEMDERIAEVDADVEARVNTGSGKATNGVARSNKMAIDDDDDDDSDNGESFVNTNRTIVAEG